MASQSDGLVRLSGLRSTREGTGGGLVPGPRTMRLLSIASDALGDAVRPSLGRAARVLGLDALIEARNGFYAFESALHVLPSEVSAMRTIERWNAPDGWRSGYGSMADGLLFFAEDAFGGQFALWDERICTFDPETGDVDVLASSVEDWADQLLDDYRVLTGYPVAHEWQLQNGLLQPGMRLVPKVPFVIGGDYTVDNLSALDAEEGMRVRAEFAMQIRDLPDGTTVRYRAGD